MKIKYYLDNKHFLAGVTLKDQHELEENNLALHACRQQESVLYNRHQLASYLDQPLENFVFAQQTHSANVYKVTRKDKGKGTSTLDNAIANTDAIYTNEPEIILTTMSADCVPILFYHDSTGIIGAIHSGWQGTVQEITAKTFHHLIQHEQCSPDEFYVFLGPCISQEKFEVDDDVYEKFKALNYADSYMFHDAQTGKYHINNQYVVRKQCELVGIPAKNIRLDPMCTFQSDDGFSYRQDKQTGRHVSFIMRKSVLS